MSALEACANFCGAAVLVLVACDSSGCTVEPGGVCNPSASFLFDAIDCQVNLQWISCP
jgi:hypothetical protein